MLYLGVDPGSYKNGWAVMDIDPFTKKVIAKGHDEIEKIREIIVDGLYGTIDIVVIEDVVRYRVSNPIDLLATAKMIGHIQEACQYSRYSAIIPSETMTRPEVILKLTGKRPSSNHKVSKAQLQKIVQTKLGLDKPIRPQHANDAVAIVLAVVDPVKPTNVKPIRKRKQPAKA